MASDMQLPQLPLPIIESKSIKVLCGGLPDGRMTGIDVVASLVLIYGFSQFTLAALMQWLLIAFQNAALAFLTFTD